jgi:uncharacterized membrane protein
MGLKKTLYTLGLGAGLMYYYDPELGAGRRDRLRKEWTRLQHDVGEFWGQAQRDLRERSQSFKSDARFMSGKGSETISFDSKSFSGAEAGEWTPGIRLVAGAAGALMSVYGLARGGIKGTAATFLGLRLLMRGLTNQSMGGMAGIKQSGAVEVTKTMTVDAPVEEVFGFWRAYENFPRFMAHVREVRDLGDARSHWVVDGPAGKPVEWDAVITEMQPNQVLAWQSVPGSEVENRGHVRFDDVNGRTRVTVRMSYTPPGGALGHAVASFFGKDPETAMDEDLGRFKVLVEGHPTEGMGHTYESTSTDRVSPSGGKARGKTTGFEKATQSTPAQSQRGEIRVGDEEQPEGFDSMVSGPGSQPSDGG